MIYIYKQKCALDDYESNYTAKAKAISPTLSQSACEFLLFQLQIFCISTKYVIPFLKQCIIILVLQSTVYLNKTKFAILGKKPNKQKTKKQVKSTNNLTKNSSEKYEFSKPKEMFFLKTQFGWISIGVR